MEDGTLWVAYETADDSSRLGLARRIVETHLPFLRYYAARTSFPYWPDQVREEYLQELVIVALGKVSSYNRLRIGESGKVAKFVTYLKPYLQGVRWDISAREAPIRVGRETRRMRADAQRFIWERQQVGVEPSWAEVADAVSRAHGKKVSAERVERIVNPPSVTSGDAVVTEDGDEMWSVVGITEDSAEAQVVETVYQEQITDQVRQAVEAIVETDLEEAIVADRLMAAPGEAATHAEIGHWFEVSAAEVARIERGLMGRLRGALS